MKATIYDVAREAGVSIATVSMVINDTGRISEKTRKKVFHIMQELRFQPSILASALSGKQTYTIGLLIPDLANPFFAEIARAVEDRGQELGFSVVMCSTDNDPSKEEKYVKLLRQKKVDGFLLVAGFQSDSILKELVEENIPLVLVSQDIPSLRVDSVMVDDFLGGYQVAEYLVSMGHRNIAVIAQTAHRSSKERIRGYQQALVNAGIAFDASLVLQSDDSIEHSQFVAGKLLDQSDPPTAIFACNDLLAMGVMQAARERNIKIPGDLSLVGFDDTIMAKIVDPPLTSVAQPTHEMGRKVMDVLIEKIENHVLPKQRTVLLPTLVIRDSVQSPTVRDAGSKKV